MSYGDIIKTFPGSEQKDMVVPDSGGKIYYNGLSTIKKKTTLALEKAGGVMIWQLLQDAQNDKSLLSGIDAVLKKGAVKK